MPLSFPQPIADYFAADTTDGVAVAKCFTPDAVVLDEKKTYTGHDAIAAWKAEASAQYDYVAEPVAIENQDDRVIVTAHLTGNFPGSPVDLRYAFTLSGDAISRLEIVP
ncbi:nuclear transport factor 2 family protein [Chelatococcus asaccharovorans]|uniref:nuclear transport factor 2 family protein n=1 Tax=Chelatococcus asaccharovorans TaxID=28210 RepID=UPI00224C6D4A|nr:nuclear transport factor 2 family protein [Chelatococcus asaccharovorans]CAH1659723.1 SnoaL-like protein [Chelatococcus asaccharovorans]CAH1687740.1 SnoaL-like protein [Chelatococcus asaccharovorans]